MTKNNWQDFFEDYYFDRLDAKSKSAFETALSENTELQSEYNEFLSLAQSTELSSIKNELLEKREINDYLKTNFRKNRYSKKWLWVLIAFLLLLVGVLSYPSLTELKLKTTEVYQQEEKEEEEEEFFSAEKEIQEEESELIPESKEQEETFQEFDLKNEENLSMKIAMVNDYLKRSYNSDVLTRGLSQRENNNDQNLQHCILLIQNTEYNKALNCLESEGMAPYTTEYYWLKALAHLGLGNYNKTIENLELVQRDRLTNFLKHANDLRNELK